MRIGRFEQCDGGTIFLDEIGDMSLLTQGKILRLIQEQRFERVGGSETIQTNVRLIAATHKNLETMVAEGTCREDLYYRLNVCQIQVPPLRERVDDIPLLVRHFLSIYSKQFGSRTISITPEAMEALQRYRWPGNVRELQSVLQQALLQAVGRVLTIDNLPKPVTAVRTECCVADEPHDVNVPTHSSVVRHVQQLLQAGSTSLYSDAIAIIEWQLRIDVMNHTHSNISKAATTLGITRPTLRAKLNNHGLTVERR